MIDKFVIGSGRSRRVIEMVRDKDQRRSAAGALKGFLFPTPQAHQKAKQQGERRAADYRRQQRNNSQMAFA